MNFCIISPTEGLERYATRSKYHMVLAHQFMKDKQYRQFYIERKLEGDFIFLDNGVYENAYDEKTHLAAISVLQPNVAVLPDVLCRAAESTKLSLDFLKRYGKEFSKTQFMFIPQGETLSGWKASYKCLPRFLNIAPVWLGLTRFLPTHTCKGDPLIRVRLATEIRSEWPILPMHAMGMADGSLNELIVLNRQGYVYSIDSSAPVWRGWLGCSLRSQQCWRTYNCEVDFEADLDDVGVYERVINTNLEVVLGICNGVQDRAGDYQSAG